MQRGVPWTSDGVSEGDDRNAARRPRLLLLCDFRPHEAATVLDHIEAIRRWSRYDVFVLPIHGDLPDEVDLEAFDGLVIHYNVVMSHGAYLSPLARWRISKYSGVKAAFIQDEYRFVNRTISVMRTLGIHVLFTCVPEDQVELVYPDRALPQMTRKVTVLTGYVPHQLLALPVMPYDDRILDVGYRGRRLPPWLGTLAREKAEIADRFAADAPAFGLTVDISCREGDRLYGKAWIDFVSGSKAMLGVESGANVFDFDGSIEQAVREYASAQPDAPFEELHRIFLHEVDGRIRLNQISPRCFEAAALGTLMVLYPGDYSGVLEPWRHYVPLQKDHSNMAEVVRAIRDRETWEQITRTARQEIALNPRYSYRAMVEMVDEGLDLTVASRNAIHPDAFEQIAMRNVARMPGSRLHAMGLPPAINRVRLAAGRVARILKPSAVAISASPVHATEKAHTLRQLVRHTRSLTYWAIRPHLVPPGLLIAHGSTLREELSDLVRLQEMGARAIAAGAESPFALIIVEGTGEVRIVLREDIPTSARAVAFIPDALSWTSWVSVNLTNEWLVPLGSGECRARRLEALSAVMRARPHVGRGLLTGRRHWCDVFLLKVLAGG